MAAGIYEEVTDVVSCEICYELLEGRKPRQLPCLHAFCEECLQQLLDRARTANPQTSSISCPICKRSTNIPGGCVAKLPFCFYVSKVHSIRKTVEDRYKICKLCQSAGNKAKVSSYCFNCVTGHCSNCRANHDEIFENHVQISVTPSTVNCIMCADHDAHFTYFCMTCSKAVCTHCYVGNHSKHKIYDLAYDEKKVEENVKEFLLSGMRSVDKSLANLEQLECKLSRDIKAAMKDMKRHQEHLLKQVNDQYESLVVELNQKEAQMKNDLAKSKSLLEDAKSCIDRLLKQTGSWHEPVKGIPEARIKNIEQLVIDVKQQMPTLGPGIIPQDVTFTRGDMDIRFGKIVQKREF